MMSTAWRRVQEAIGLDVRSLALFRIAIAALILIDLSVRATFLEAHYTDFGLLPRAPLIEQFSPPWRISLHFLSGKLPIEACLFVIAAVFATMLLIGYRTRLATFLSWFLMLSLHTRNPMVLQAGDLFFRNLLFWGLFLPLGARWSVDAQRRTPAKPADAHVVSVGTLGYALQVACVYWFTAAIKLTGNSFPVWWKEGSAVYYALHVDQFTTPFGLWVRALPFPFLQGLNYAVIFFEIIGPFLLFVPAKWQWLRGYGVLGFIGMHLGLRSCMALGPFPWVSSIAMLPFLPAGVWSWLLPRIQPWGRALGPFAGLIQDRWAQFVRHPGWRWVGWSPLRKASRSIVEPASLTLSRPANLFAVFLICYTFFWNMGTLNSPYGLPKSSQWLGVLIGLEQRWNMFSPPLRDDGWYVIPGKLKNGHEVNVFTAGGPVSWERPQLISATYRNERQRKYMMNLWLAVNAGHRLYFGKYLCRDWNRSHEGAEQLETFEIVFMRENTPAPGQPMPTPQRVSTWTHWCFERPKTKATSTR